MTYTTKAASDLTYQDRIVLDGRVFTVVDRTGIVSTHSPGRVGYLIEDADRRVYRLSLNITDRMEMTSC